MEVKCLKCDKVKVVKNNPKDRANPSPFCGSCSGYYGELARLGKIKYSLIDEYILKHIPTYNPSGPYTFICKCDNEQTYTTKSSLFRILIGSNMCGKCSRSAKRQGWTLSPEIVKKMRETAIIHQTPYDSVEEWSKSKKDKDSYYDAVDRMSRTNLRLYNPKEYVRWKNNTYDGTNYKTGLSIEHDTPKSVCLREGWSIEKAAHINNLKVVTQEENNKLWKKYTEKNNIKNGSLTKIVKEQTHNFW